MAKNTQYHCQQCGSVTPKWAGRCEACSAWNSIVEEQISSRPGLAKSAKSGRKIEFSTLEQESSKQGLVRMLSGISEFDRVTGGGIVPGSVLLIGGDPGIGKSTLLLQLACKLSHNKTQTVYITGEESADQVRLRGQRLGLKDSQIGMAVDSEDRLNGYQTSSPFRDYALFTCWSVTDRRSAESEAHVLLDKMYERRGEWFNCTPEQAQSAIAELMEQHK